jgi:hypothetical protein
VIAGFFALLQQGLGVVRVFDIRVPVVPSDMTGNELVPEIDTQAIGTNHVIIPFTNLGSEGDLMPYRTRVENRALRSVQLVDCA